MKTFNSRQAANYLACDVKTLRKLVNEGQVVFKDESKPGSKLRKLRFTQKDLDKLKYAF